MFRLLDLLVFLRRKCYHIGYYVFPGLLPHVCKYFSGLLFLPTGRRATGPVL